MQKRRKAIFKHLSGYCVVFLRLSSDLAVPAISLFLIRFYRIVCAQTFFFLIQLPTKIVNNPNLFKTWSLTVEINTGLICFDH